MTDKAKIIIVDYDCGNLFSLQRALREVGASSDITGAPEEIRNADKIILPGVGAFGDGMKNLRLYGLADVILESASAGKPILGICLGMQLLFNESFEFGHHKGLGLIGGKITRLSGKSSRAGQVKIPHIGWNAVKFSDNTNYRSGIFGGVANKAYMYFIHSFGCIMPDDHEHCRAVTAYGDNVFCAITQKENIIGMQFHPEISGPLGLKLLRNFVNET